MIEGKSGSATSNVMIIGIHTQALTSTSPTIPPHGLRIPLPTTKTSNTLAQ
jgi:hypothetical protein